MNMNCCDFCFVFPLSLFLILFFKKKRVLQNRYPVPKAIDNNRHVVLMSLVDGVPLYSVKSIENPKPVLQACIRILKRLVGHGLIHCDFNEFNLLINQETSEVTMIDFPQMVSTSHPNAEDYFNRDVKGKINHQLCLRHSRNNPLFLCKVRTPQVYCASLTKALDAP